MATPRDLEEGLGDPSSSSGPAPPKLSTDSAGLNSSNKSKNDLQVFQVLVGISFLDVGGEALPASRRTAKPANPFYDIFLPGKASRSRFRNRGLYDRALSQELKNRVMYSLSHYIITSFYLLQILLAATFTALSAEDLGTTVPLTTLGAVNTVVAGTLAWVTGQGMPVRFRSARDNYREVVKDIEKTERMFAEIDLIEWPVGKRPHPVKERDRLEKKYDEARQDQEANYPESQHSGAAQQATVKNQELEDKVDKKKTQGAEKDLEIANLRMELEKLKREANTGVKLLEE